MSVLSHSEAQPGGEVTVSAPSAFSEEQRKRFIDLVAAGGAVSRANVAEQLPNCGLIAFVEQHGQIVAVGCIKGDRPQYRASSQTVANLLFLQRRENSAILPWIPAIEGNVYRAVSLADW
jgi:hypothetical protein